MRRILVIEDDRILRRFVRRLLELEGYTALEAADGDEGLARAHEEDCDLVLLDIRMPKRDGWSVLEELKKRTVRPVVGGVFAAEEAVTAHRFMEDRKSVVRTVVMMS